MSISAKVQNEIVRNAAMGDKACPNGWQGGVKSQVPQNLEVGDVWQFPETWDSTNIFERMFDRTSAQYTIVEMLEGPSAGECKNIWVSTFEKSRVVYDDDMRPVVEDGKVKRAEAKGSAVTEFRRHLTRKAAMEALAGKKFKVTAIDTVKTLSFDRSRLVDAQMPVIEIIND